MKHRLFSVRERGLTFGEMLVVLAVFSILALVFIFSSNFAIVKTRYARALQESRGLINDIEMYQITYPNPPAEQDGLDVLQSVTGGREIPIDPFVQDRSAKTYDYLSNLAPNYRYVVVSVGPDGDSDFREAIEQARRESGVKLESADPKTIMFKFDAQLLKLIQLYSYDPTNGSVSNGDIITTIDGKRY